MVRDTAIASWDHTIGGDVTDGLLLVGASIEKQSGAVVSSITYAGQPLALARAATGGEGVRVELWYLTAPPPGTGQVVMTLSKSVTEDGAVAGAMSLSGVDLADPIPTTATGGATSGSPSTAIEVANENAWVVDVMMIDTGVAATTSGGQLQRWNLAETIAGSASTLGASSRGMHTMSWTGLSDNWAQVVAEIKPL
jgi:hypothetical protein